jgi:glycosyltransferase involved in cell wall biosynthesis
MSAEPLVSVYLPTRNRHALLERAVESVLAQSYAPLELIVVNDGSSDGTREYLDAQARRDPRLRVIHNIQSVGAHRARNRAIELARGEFLTGLDDDDAFHRDRVAAFVAYWRVLEHCGEAFSCLYSQDVLIKGEEQRVTHKSGSVRYQELFFYNMIGNQIFTRRERFVAAGAFDEEMPAWQDLEAFIRLVQRFGPAKLLDSALYYLNIDERGDRISVGSKQRILSAYHRLCGKHPGLPPVMKQGLFLQAFGNAYAFSAEFDDAREFLRYGLHVKTLKTLAGICARRLGIAGELSAAAG